MFLFQINLNVPPSLSICERKIRSEIIIAWVTRGFVDYHLPYLTGYEGGEYVEN